ncbi:MAG: hypothetical protein ACR2HR_18435 [Euzebya sp.]
MSADALNAAADLGDWVRIELASGTLDSNHVLRVLARETDRWFTHQLAPTDIAALAAEPARTGDARWDALIEGIVAYRFHIASMAAPDWCTATRLAEGWDPYDTPDADLGWRMLDMFETPAELLEKGVTLSHRAMSLL